MPDTTTTRVVRPDAHLLRIPNEVRNKIYGMAFAAKTEAAVSLNEATPPSKALLLAGHKTYEEAKLVYREEYRKFWSRNTFTLTHDFSRSGHRERAQTIVDGQQDEDLLHITSLRVANVMEEEYWIFDNGLWTYWWQDFTLNGEWIEGWARVYVSKPND